MKYVIAMLACGSAVAAEPVHIIVMPEPPAYIFKCTVQTCTPYQMQLKKAFEEGKK